MQLINADILSFKIVTLKSSKVLSAPSFPFSRPSSSNLFPDPVVAPVSLHAWPCHVHQHHPVSGLRSLDVSFSTFLPVINIFLDTQLQCRSLLVQVCMCMSAESPPSCPAPCHTVDCSLSGSSLSAGFSRKENWRGSLCPSPGDLPDPGMEPGLLGLPPGRHVLYHQRHL